VAVLPFQSEVSVPGLSTQVRKAFYNHFSSKPYIDVKLARVDEKVVSLEKSSGKTLADLPAGELCRAIGCDAVVYGRVTDYVKMYALVYSQLAIQAEVWMVDAKTGKEIIRVKESVRYHGTGLPLSPLGAAMSAFSAAANLRDSQSVRMINELCQKLNEKIPSPEGGAASQGPVVREVLSNVSEGPFGKNKVIRVGLEGDKGLVATFDIGNFKKGILMKEGQPGIYTGEYRVMPGDDAREMPILVSLKMAEGNETEWIDVSGLVTIDTTPPPPVAGLRARGTEERIALAWERLTGVGDLRGYRILRSTQPLSGFSPLATTEQAAFEDVSPERGIVYYYRVVAFDEAGNESVRQDAVPASLVPKEPIILSGELTRDVVLSGLYTVKDDFSVPRGLSLTIGPGARLLFDGGASLTVMGRLSVSGHESPPEFLSLTEKRWKGISVKDGTITVTGARIKGATTALGLTGAGGLIEGVVITDSDTAISVTGVPSVTIRNCTVSGNRRAVELVKTDASVVSNSIFQNTEGIVIKGFSGEIRDNNIADNGSNIVSADAVRIGANYMGSVEVGEMRLVNVAIAKAYDGRLPGGKIIDALSDPYLGVSGEERQKRAADLAAEAGDYFKKGNYGKASALFEASLKAEPAPETYHFLALSYQEMKDEDKALAALKAGSARFPRDSTLMKALGMLLSQKGDEAAARDVFRETLRLNSGDSQVRFLLERMNTEDRP
jgi:hypothetical protein